MRTRPPGGIMTPTLRAAMACGGGKCSGGVGCSQFELLSFLWRDSSFGTGSNCAPRYSPTRRQTSVRSSAEYDWKTRQPGLCCAPIREAEVNNNVLPYLWGNDSAPGYHTEQAVTFPLLYVCTCQSVWYGNAPLGLT